MVSNKIPGEESTPIGVQVDESETPPEPVRLPPPDAYGGKVDKEIFAAWKEYMVQGYQHNTEMFERVLDAFMRPYWMTVWMYRLVFTVGILGFVLAVALGAWKGIEFAILFGGLTLASFLTYFISRPLQSLEQNLMLITWLGVIYNTYWARLMYATDPAKVQAELEQITKTAIDGIVQLVDKHSELSGNRPKPES